MSVTVTIGILLFTAQFRSSTWQITRHITTAWASAHRGKWGQLTPWKNG